MALLPSPFSVPGRHAAQLIALVIGLVSTGAAYLSVDRTIRLQRETRFRQAVETSTTAVTDRMQAYSTMLHATRGFFDALGEVPSRPAFAAFVRGLEVAERYPGVQGIGFAAVIPRAQLHAHEARERASGADLYTVWPAGERDVYTSIVYLEPLDWRNARAIGFDMFSEPVRRAAMERARDTGKLAASGRVELVQEAGEIRQGGFLVYLPVYERPPRTPEERHALLRGWVYAPFRAADLLQRTVGAGAARDVALHVYDGAEVRPDALLYAARAEPVDGQAPLLQRIDVGGRTWTLHFAATGAFVSATERALPPLALLLGLVATAILVRTVRRETQARRWAEQSARRTAFLAEAGKILASSLDYARTLPEVGRLAAEEIADAAILFVDGERGAPLWCVAHADADHAARLEAALRRRGVDPAEEAGVAAVLRTRAPELLARIDAARHPMIARDPELAALAREARIRSVLTVPILARGAAIGALVLAASSRRRRFGADDVALAEDLARLVAAAVDTARLYRDAQDAVRERDEFLSIASHELKTPLTSLALQSESLRAAARRGDAEGTARKADVVRRNVKRLAALVASMLDLSRIRAGRLELELEDVDLAEVAREVVGRFEDEAHRAGCTLALDAPEPVVGHWDRLRVDQVVTNLLSNAVKYGPGKPVEVRVGTTGGERAVLSVRDHGIGISAEDQRRIFDQFERAVSDRHYGGFGLGLWIVRSIVESLGGTVRVESAPGEGSTFTVELERARAAAARRADGDVAQAPGREA
jgi:signal transduction histidine kinase/CHASE1-domain containing sensor protein